MQAQATECCPTSVAPQQLHGCCVQGAGSCTSMPQTWNQRTGDTAQRTEVTTSDTLQLPACIQSRASTAKHMQLAACYAFFVHVPGRKPSRVSSMLMNNWQPQPHCSATATGGRKRASRVAVQVRAEPILCYCCSLYCCLVSSLTQQGAHGQCRRLLSLLLLLLLGLLVRCCVVQAPVRLVCAR
jgi:hypothetical protein